MGRHARARDEEVRTLNLLRSAIAASLLAGPLLLGIWGLVQASRAPRPVDPPSFRSPWNWRLTAASMLLYVFAYNLTFFIQELFLVLPKAMTPGLTPTLFHNNHTWDGDHEVVGLLQGTGALAILVTGLLSAALLRWASSRTATTQLFLIWMAFHGLIASLSQVVIGAMSSGSDVGMAMAHLHFTELERTSAALGALVLIPLVALGLTPHLLALANPSDRLTTPKARTRHLFLIATLPAIVGFALIIPFRVPREWSEVLLPPAVVTWAGIAWMQAGAWNAKAKPFEGRTLELSVAIPLSAVVALLVIFQLLLRPGIQM